MKAQGSFILDNLSTDLRIGLACAREVEYSHP